MEFADISAWEFARLIKRRMRRYLAFYLDSLEAEIGEDTITCPECGEKVRTDAFPIARKHLLDCLNDYTRGIWHLIGIEIEGTNIYE